MNLLWL